MNKFTIPISFTSLGSVEIEADDIQTAQFKAEKLLAGLYSAGNPTTSKEINWNDAEAMVNYEDIDLDDMAYLDD